MHTDILTRIKNAQAINKATIKVPFSNFHLAVLELLSKNQYIESAQKKGRAPKRIIEIKLRYINERGAIDGIRFLSKPSRRLYAGFEELRPVKQGHGLLVVSTSRGLMTGLEARRAKLGGELLFEIW